MKKLVLFLAFVLVTKILFAQWQWQNPYPQGYDLNDVQLIDSLTCWTVGEFGSIIKTEDGGNAWVVLHENSDEVLNALSFTDYDYGWAVGDSGYVINTDDGGYTWNQQSSGTNFKLLDVQFIDGDNGWAVGIGDWDDYYWWSKTLVINTTNGGITWEVQLLDSTFLLEAIHFLNDTLGWAVGRVNWNDTLPVPDNYSYITHTINGGNTWEEQDVESLWGFSDVYFYDNSKGWAAGHRNIWHTEDGGNTWIGQVENDIHSFTSICFSNSEIGWCLGYTTGAACLTPSIYKTYDGGTNWQIENFYLPECKLHGISLYDDNNVWVVGDLGKIMHTSNGGNTWQSQSGVYSPGALKELFFIDHNHGWAVGTYWAYPWNGIIMQTFDGGESWSFEDWTAFAGPTDIYFTDSLNGWMTGQVYEASFIKQTTNGGISWNDQLTIEDHYIYDIFFTDMSDGWIVGHNWIGNGENIYHTSNGGNNWEMQDAGTDVGLEGVYFLDNMEGWAVGWEGTILHTINGGENWEMITSGVTEDIKGIYFLNNQHGWAFGCEFIMQTSDGGISWETQFTGSNICFHSMKFTSENTGWIVGEKENGDGLIFFTTDGGNSWLEMYHGITDRKFTSVFFIDEDNGWISGDKGTILHINNGSIVDVTELYIEENNTLLYPNPSNGFVTITSKLITEREARIFVYNINGQMIEDNIIYLDGQNHYRLDCSDYVPGIYLITIRSNKKTQTNKLIIE